MDLNNGVIQLCIQGTRAEFQGRQAEARMLYHQAWETARDEYEKCIAAHYVARLQESHEEAFQWNQEALIQAEAVDDDRVKSFYPSLYLNMGLSYERLGKPFEAKRYYDLAAALGAVHQVE